MSSHIALRSSSWWRNGLAGATVAVIGGIAAFQMTADRAGSAVSPDVPEHARAGVAALKASVAPDSLELLRETPTSETLLTGRSPDGSRQCFLVIDPPEAPASGISMSCGAVARAEEQGQIIWREEGAGRFTAWAHLPAGSSLLSPATGSVVQSRRGAAYWGTVGPDSDRLTFSSPAGRLEFEMPPRPGR